MLDSPSLLGRLAGELIGDYGDHRHDDELTRARDEYCDRRGRVFEDEEEWERFSRAFLEWYVLERPWRDRPHSPAHLAASAEEDERRRGALCALARSQRALALVGSSGKGGVSLRDMVGGAEFFVTEERSLAGMDAGDVAELRLIGFEEKVYFGNTFIFHPAEAAEAIEGLIARQEAKGKGRAEIIDHLALLRRRSRSYKHVSPVRIYEQGGVVGPGR
jgi:hypothetical protein